MKYAFLFVVFVFIVGGAYFAGRYSGKQQSRIEYITKEVEVIRYVDKKKSEIYSAPNANRSELVRLLHNGEL